MQGLWEVRKNGAKGWVNECLWIFSSVVSSCLFLGLHCSQNEVFLQTRVGVVIEAYR